MLLKDVQRNTLKSWIDPRRYFWRNRMIFEMNFWRISIKKICETFRKNLLLKKLPKMLNYPLYGFLTEFLKQFCSRIFGSNRWEYFKKKIKVNSGRESLVKYLEKKTHWETLVEIRGRICWEVLRRISRDFSEGYSCRIFVKSSWRNPCSPWNYLERISEGNPVKVSWKFSKEIVAEFHRKNNPKDYFAFLKEFVKVSLVKIV